MAGLIIFDPDNEDVGLSTGDSVALNTYLDIENDVLYYTDGLTIYEWEGDQDGYRQTYVWRSGEIRLASPVNMGAAIVEAELYSETIDVTTYDITFRLYADGVLKHTQTVLDDEPFRLPGGYLSNIYAVEIESALPVTRVSVAENIFELTEG